MDKRIKKIASLITEDPDVFNPGPSQRAEMHKEISRSYRSEREKWIINTVRKHIMAGESAMKEPLENATFSMDEVIEAMKAKRCLSAKDQDLGHTYVKNTIGNIIRDEFTSSPGPTGVSINDARKVFGLPPIDSVTSSQRKKRKGV